MTKITSSKSSKKKKSGRKTRLLPRPSTQEASIETVPLPAVVARLVRVPDAADGAALNAPPILYPHRPAKTNPGRDELTSLADQILSALAIYTHVTLRLLQANGMELLHAEPILQGAAGRSHKHLLKLSAKKLEEFTCFDNNNGIVSWAASPADIFHLTISPKAPLPDTPLNRGLEAVRLISTGLARTERVTMAIHATQLASNEEIGAALKEAFAIGAALNAMDLFHLAMISDANPAPLWREFAHFADLFELARFIGKIDRSAQALLPTDRLTTMLDVLDHETDMPPDDATLMHQSIRTAIDRHFGVQRFQTVLEQAIATKGIVAVDRKTRRLRHRTDAGLIARIFGRASLTK